MQELCDILKIGYSEDFINKFGEKQLSGDSGRRDTKFIEKRMRRKIPKEIESYLNGEHYKELLEKLGYQ